MKREATPHPKLKALSANIRARRISKKLTLDVLANASGISFQQLSNVEHSRNWPSMLAYLLISDRLGAGKIPLVDSP